MAEQEARSALAAWDKNMSPALCLEKGEALAECMRALLAELDAERQIRNRER